MATVTDRFCCNLLGNRNLGDVSEGRFVWRTGHVRKPGSEKLYTVEVEIKIKVEGSSTKKKVVRMDKTFFFLEDTIEGRLRNALEPFHATTFHLRCLSLTTPFIYAARSLYRLIELVRIFSVVFFRTFLELYRENPEEDFSMKFAIELKRRMRQLKKDFYELGSKMKTDITCAAVMEGSAFRGQFSSDPLLIMRMMVYFSEAEYKWNEGVTVGGNAPNRCRNFMKKYHANSKEYNFAKFLKALVSIAKEHNRGLMSYECVYPLSEEYKTRVECIRKFSSYKAAVQFHKEKNTEAKKKKEEEKNIEAKKKKKEEKPLEIVIVP